MTRHNLPSGGWVELRDASELKAKDRKRVMRNLGDPQEGHVMASVVDMTDGIIATMVTAWELPYLLDAPLPSVQIDVLDELELADENVLQKLTEGAAKMFQSGGVDPSEYDNPDSPTVPASA